PEHDPTPTAPITGTLVGNEQSEPQLSGDAWESFAGHGEPTKLRSESSSLTLVEPTVNTAAFEESADADTPGLDFRTAAKAESLPEGDDPFGERTPAQPDENIRLVANEE